MLMWHSYKCVHELLTRRYRKTASWMKISGMGYIQCKKIRALTYERGV